MPKLKYQKYIVTELKLPEEIQKRSAEWIDSAPRILWLDNKVVEGAFQMTCIWYLKPEPTKAFPAHTHDFDEIIGFFGSDPQNPHDLGGEIEFWLEDEKYMLTKSCLIFAPKGMKHCPLVLKRVDRPIFHFTTVTGGQYTKKVVPTK